MTEQFTNKPDHLRWRIGGEAGFGILSAGMIFAKIASRGGLFAFATSEYPSLIRGGHNFLNVRIGPEQVDSHCRYVDLLVALNKETYDKHSDLLTRGAAVVWDPSDFEIDADEADAKGILLVPVQLTAIAKEHGSPILRNTIAIGASIALAGYDLDLFKGVLSDTFSRKGDAVVKMNIGSAQAGYDAVGKEAVNRFPHTMSPKAEKDTILISGNESIAAGAVQAGCKLVAAYPMTPASSVMMTMAKLEKGHDVVVKHTEDELAAINMAVGGNFAGVRSMTATSGGGFCLMTEAFGMANVSETPLVVVEAQRPGPGTGMATHTGQADLRMILHAATDEAPRIIIAPGDADECFYGTQLAFNLAEEYQMSVVILTDKFLADSYQTVGYFDKERVPIKRGKLLTDVEAEKETDYRRYRFTDDGISPRSIPGQPNCNHVCTSYEHNEHGTEDEDEENRNKMFEKRFGKMDLVAAALDQPVLFGPADADYTVISWGSTKGVVRQSMLHLAEDGIRVSHLHLMVVNPLPMEVIDKVMSGPSKTVIIEANHGGQLQGMIKEKNGLDPTHHIRKNDGRPFYPDEIVDAIRSYGQNGTGKEGSR
ncbi:MAG: 2-oxoacid:acceptor oxidoreductase subunit alpha [archaeon]